MLNLVRQILEWKFGDLDKVSAFLDFACGYGRFTRFLVTMLPPERIWVSDIYESGVEFQREQFGVNGTAIVHRQPKRLHWTRKARPQSLGLVSLFLPMGWL